MSIALAFHHVDILFQRQASQSRIEEALRRLDAGGTREEIARDLSVTVGVANASLAVERGEISVLMGLSGSGKSTLLRAANALNTVTRGEVRIGNGSAYVDIASCEASMLRELRATRIAMVFQQFNLLPWRTVRDNVGWGLELRGMGPGLRHKIVDEKLELVGLTRWADSHVGELSGGMQQRVGLARAFATDADILLMDEPFSALDPLIRRKLQDELLDLQRRLKKTIVFVTHDIDEALKIGNQITIMREGRIVQTGTPDDIVLNPANDYVAEFIRQMNPLPVLNAKTVMRHMPEGTTGFVLITKNPETIEITPGLTYCAPTGWPLSWIAALRQRSGMPVLIGDDGRVVGICDDADMLRALTGIARSAVPA